MHVLQLAFFISGFAYAFISKQELIFYYSIIVLGYILISMWIKGEPISNRKKIMVSTWSQPSEGIIQIRLKIRTQKVDKIIQEYARQGKIKLTLTNFILKACGEVVKDGRQVNGKLVFGKYVPYKTIDISCLVNLDDGNDLAVMNVTEVDKKSVEEIATFIKETGEKMKKNKGGHQHKKRTFIVDYLPAFLVFIVMRIVNFVSCRLNISIPFLSIKKNAFGVGCITSLGMLGFEDVHAPFSEFMNYSFLVSVGKSVEAPVVEDGEVKVGKVMTINVGIDHKYVDGGQSTKFVPIFKQVFENPEQFLKRKESDQK